MSRCPRNSSPFRISLLYVCMIYKIPPSKAAKKAMLKPQDLLPIHPVFKVQDWDDAPGAIDWPRLRDFLRIVKQTGQIPSWHKSHDHLNEQKEVPLDKGVYAKWKDTFEALRTEREEKGEKVVWGVVDGFLLYWDPVRAS